MDGRRRPPRPERAHPLNSPWRTAYRDRSSSDPGSVEEDRGRPGARVRRHVWAQLPDGLPASKVAGTDLGDVVVTAKLRTGSAGSNTGADHIEVLTAAVTITEKLREAIARVPAKVWTPATDADGGIRDGAQVAELTGLLDLAGWPEGMRIIVRRERPHPGAQLPVRRARRLALPSHRHQHRNRTVGVPRGPAPPHARVEDRIRHAKDTGLGRFPSREFAINRAWLTTHRDRCRPRRLAAAPRPVR